MTGGFDFGSLDPDKKKTPQEVKIPKPKDEKPKEMAIEPKKIHISDSTRVSNEKIFEKIENLENQMNKLIENITKTPPMSIVTQPSFENISFEQKTAPSENLIQKPLDNPPEISDISEISEKYILKIPEITECNILNKENIDWVEVFRLAKTNGWLLNIYTFTRFLEHLDSLLGNIDKRRKFTTAWIRVKKKDEMLKAFGLHWEQTFVLRLGKTQQDIIDTFADSGNKPQSSNHMFDSLAKKDPQHYDKNKANNIDLRRVRNVLSQLNSWGFIETSRSIDNLVLFNLKRK